MIWGRRRRGGPVQDSAGTAEESTSEESREEEDLRAREQQEREEVERAAQAAAAAAAEREERRRAQGPLDAAEVPAASDVPGEGPGSTDGPDGPDGPDGSDGPEEGAPVGEGAARPPQPARIDLGALQVPAVQGMELRLEMEERTQRVMGVVVAIGAATLQLQAFAAPRKAGIWDEIRADLAGQVARQGGATEEREGPFGTELLARLPVRTEDGRTGHSPARFVGVDGPRWFLRAVLGGQAAVDASAAAVLEQVLRGVVVVRGAEAMAPRDLLPLQLPPQDQARPAAGGEGDPQAPAGAPQDGPGPVDPFRRGPEITERR